MKYFVYKLSNDNGVYYGKTNNIKCRMYKHRSIHNNCCSKVLFENLEKGVKIDILETFDNEESAALCENQYIKNNYNECVNKVIPLQTRHQHYINNKERLLNDKKMRITCECGCQISKRHIARHKKSIKHQNLINNMNNNVNNI